MMRSRTLFISILIYASPLFYGIPVFAQAENEGNKFNPYLPGELNEYALESLRSGDSYTAQIFLERANRLNPLSPDIQANLEIIRKLRKSGESVEVRGASTVDGGDASKQNYDGTNNTLPALWPKP